VRSFVLLKDQLETVKEGCKEDEFGAKNLIVMKKE